MYSDTTEYQSALRRAFWTISDKEVKRSFYHWGMQLYKAALYHAKPIPQSRHSDDAKPIFHGMLKMQ